MTDARPARRAGRSVLASALVALVALAATACGGAPPPPVTSAVSQPSATPVPTSELAVTMDETFLNTALNGRLAGRSLGDTPFGPATLQGLSVDVEEGRLGAKGTAQAGFLSLPLLVTFTLDVQDGRAVVSVHDASIAGAVLPAGASQEIQRALQAEIDRLVDPRVFRIRAIEAQADQLVVRGSPRLAP